MTMPALDRLVISSVHGDPLHPRTWSAAPYRVAEHFRSQGVAVHGAFTRAGRVTQCGLALRHLASGLGLPHSGEALARGPAARRRAALGLEAVVKRTQARHVLHLGTLDIVPEVWAAGVRHFAYCDQTWALSLRYRPDAARYGVRALERFEALEREALRQLAHVFTFGAYVRDHVIGHYGVDAARVSAIGSGMGPIAPLVVPKVLGAPRLLFVAKHFFAAKGGELLLAAFAIARKAVPDLTLNIVGDERSRKLVPRDASIRFFGHVPLADLQGLYREATLLVQPMLNDPWGQVYLEALVSRTPVVGLRRNGLPEICGNGRYGFMVDKADPKALAATIVDALSDPARLARMGEEGQQHVLGTYSWERSADRIATVMRAERPAPTTINRLVAGAAPASIMTTMESEGLHHV